MIPVMDARTGQIVSIGETVQNAPKWYKLVRVADWLLRARVTVHTPDGARHLWIPISTRTTPFGRQRVAIYPS